MGLMHVWQNVCVVAAVSKFISVESYVIFYGINLKSAMFYFFAIILKHEEKANN